MDRPTVHGSRVAQNAAALLGGRVVTGVVGLVTVPALYGMLGSRRFGLWALLLGLAAIAGLLDFGLGSAQVREVACATGGGDPRRARAVLALGMVCSAGLALVVGLAAALGWPLLAHVFDLSDLAGEGRAAALLLVASLMVDGLASPWRAALEGTQRLRSVAFITVTSAIAGGAGGVALVAAGHGLAGLGWSVLTGSVLRLSLLFVTARRWACGMRPSIRAIDRNAVLTALRYGWRVQLSSGAAVINNDADRLVLGAFSSTAAVSPFDLGSRLANVLRLAPTYVIIAVFPAAAALHARGDRAALDRTYVRTTRYLAMFAAVAAAALVASADPLVVLWLGRRVPMVVATVCLLAPGYAVNLASGAASAVTRAEGAPERETRYALLAAGLNVVLTVPLLVALGPPGVPLSTTLAYVAATAYFFWHFHRSSGRAFGPVLEAIWKPFAAAGCAALVSWIALGRSPIPAERLAAVIAAGSRAGLVVLLSVGMLIALGFFDAEDRRVITRAVARLRIRDAAPTPAHAAKGAS
ncbi:MAG: oligosaccharide flippase family protein [Actinomycetota bacterium]